MQKSSNEKTREEFGIDLSQLPQTKQGWLKQGQTLYQGCWYPSRICPFIIAFQQNFHPQDQDIIFASNPKSGTTWMKALLFSIMNRTIYAPSETPLLASSPHDLVPFFEFTLFNNPPKYDIAKISSPRLFATHLAYASLPNPVLSKSRIIYLCRNPLDTIASFWHFLPRYYPNDDPKLSLEHCIEAFCKGQSSFGPFWDHVLGFWTASLETPEKVLFLKYEDLWEDTTSQVKKLAEFVGFPFSDEEERCGVVEQIVDFCSIGNLKKLDVNKNGKLATMDGELGGDIFFRKGEVGDWVNLLSPFMVESVNKVIKDKLSGSGLTFKYKL